MKCTLTLSNDRSESKRIEKAWVGTAMFVAVLAATLVSVSIVPTPAHAEPNSEIDAADDGRITQAIKDKKRDGTYQTFRVNERRNIARKKWHKTTTIPSHLSGAAGDTREQKIKDLIRQAKEGWQGGPDFVRTELVYGDNYSMLRIDRF